VAHFHQSQESKDRASPAIALVGRENPEEGGSWCGGESGSCQNCKFLHQVSRALHKEKELLRLEKYKVLVELEALQSKNKAQAA